MRYHYTLKRMVKIQKADNKLMAIKKQELLFFAGGTAKWDNHIGRQFGGFLRS